MKINNTKGFRFLNLAKTVSMYVLVSSSILSLSIRSVDFGNCQFYWQHNVSITITKHCMSFYFSDML